jgi:hypothetical protein
VAGLHAGHDGEGGKLARRRHGRMLDEAAGCVATCRIVAASRQRRPVRTGLLRRYAQSRTRHSSPPGPRGDAARKDPPGLQTPGLTRDQRNALLGRSGTLWQAESFDRIIRDEEHLYRCMRYIGRNPRTAGLAGGQFRTWVRPAWEALGWRIDEA